jgi:hypothetical protein
MSCTPWMASGGKRSISPVGQHGESTLADRVVFVGIRTMVGVSPENRHWAARLVTTSSRMLAPATRSASGVYSRGL